MHNSFFVFTFVKSKRNRHFAPFLYTMELKDRIRLIMEDQHMTQQVFADFLQLAPATLSSIFNGRTRPTLNIVEAIKTKIPDISSDWLLWGSGSMYHTTAKTDTAAVPTPPEAPSAGADQLLNFEQPSLFPHQELLNASQEAVQQPTIHHGVKSTQPETIRKEIKIIDKEPRKVVEIRVYYDDQTYETFTPSKP